ncbi:MULTISPECIES: dihydropteroate synthase [Cyanophyceae]|uniref:dihydropteroate synthase n=1 Tax=Cyanophyceae TaxID=3028117 RepID=UPI0023303C15|nr:MULTISPECIES: dihydropteroate synthase [Cyanophyceae]MDB9356417.1 dihydropteroate synthase [Nodularia spumigena CS-587/03]MDB9317152.1 dihydropteroate synthase [Nodularia spumigena CS-590/01A]MDB9323453.1 dihydropteroate synthase [Nodularia spumigena CS-591/07A]MDB9325684.1 dihydropteroate synthase [Nodularia spumigena CS-590/02]MDB9332585.1 dihydropteroate synthase [Nodularia spumigena CS-591/04]
MSSKLIIRESCFVWGQRTYLMGVLNITPDSFSDGGVFNNRAAALAQAQAMVAAGADIIDVGGQSTRPGAEQITLAEELDRVLPILQILRRAIAVPISVDTTRAAVARASIEAGADIINDISGGTFDLEMLPTVASLDVPIILMHIKGTPQTMQQMTDYQDLMADISSFLANQILAAKAVGINQNKIMIDPGIGFAKNYEQNLEIFRRLPELKALNCPILVGASRKSFIGRILNQPDPKARVWGTAAACCAAISHGADILRVHDVQEMRDVSLVADALFREQGLLKNN